MGCYGSPNSCYTSICLPYLFTYEPQIIIIIITIIHALLLRPGLSSWLRKNCRGRSWIPVRHVRISLSQLLFLALYFFPPFLSLSLVPCWLLSLLFHSFSRLDSLPSVGRLQFVSPFWFIFQTSYCPQMFYVSSFVGVYSKGGKLRKYSEGKSENGEEAREKRAIEKTPCVRK